MSSVEDVNFGIDSPEIKEGSLITIGTGIPVIVVHVSQHFNWFQKKMIRWCFGFKVEDICEDFNND